MARDIGLQAILLLLYLLCGHSLAQNSFEVSPEAFQILASEVEKLSKLVDQQNGVISVLNDRLNQQERTIEDLKTKLVKHDSVDRSSNNNSTEPKTTSNKVPLQHSSGQIKDAGNVRQGIIRKRQNPSTTVAFFAQRYENNIGIHQNLIFEDIRTNIGNGYSNIHGQEFWAEMMVSGSVIARLNGHGIDGRYATGTQTAIVFLHKGDYVSVQNYNHVDGFWGDKYSSFGGVLLQEYEAGPIQSIIG